MSVSVGVVDYGRGNLHSIVKALECIGASVRVLVSDHGANCDVMMIPGVGAFADGMRGLRERGLDNLIRRFVDCGGSVLGICLGCQMLMSSSEEFEGDRGLGFIPGRVGRIPVSTEPIPHVGWKQLQTVGRGGVHTDTALGFLREDFWGYFVHSYHCLPEDPSHILATVRHGASDVTAAIGRNRVVGVQFHPEKSGSAGLGMLHDYLKRHADGAFAGTAGQK